MAKGCRGAYCAPALQRLHRVKGYLYFTAVPYTVISAAPCMMDAEA